jgi:quercetin dioxygenase-like cupin family protein
MNAAPSDRDPLVPFLATRRCRRAALRGLGGGLTALALAVGVRQTAAQEATPVATPPGGIAAIEAEPGVTIEIFASAPSAQAPGQFVYVSRATFQPGAVASPHSHPGTTVIGVESGAWVWTLLAGTAHVIRGAGAGGSEVEDVAEPGTEVLLQRGDAIFYEEDVVHTARGASDEPAVLYGVFVLPSGEPLMVPVEMDTGTPAA